MASKTIGSEPQPAAVREPQPAVPEFGPAFRKFLSPLASLKLTVTLFAMAIFIVFAGTFAQVDNDIWQVIDEYFRCGIAWIDFQLFFPPSFFPSRPQIPGGFYFPGGWLIGALMFVNLLAAHGLRFKPQAAGRKLTAGLAVIAVGLVMTWLVIVSGSNKAGVQAATWIEWSTLWGLFKWGLAALAVAAGYALWKLPRERSTERWILTTFEVLLVGVVGWLLYEGQSAQLGDSSMRILWQLIKGTFAGLVLLVGCIMVFKKRAGIVLLHGGVALMMLSELLVGTMAVEGQMNINEGETANFVQDIRTLELAIVDPSNPETDDVVVIPGSILRGGGVIGHELLPFDVEVVDFLQNSKLRRVTADDENPADAGVGREWIVDEVRPGSGTDTGGDVDMSAAYLKFIDKQNGKELGTYLLGLLQSAQGIPENVTTGGTTYDVFLRFKRTYKPYSMYLKDVRKDDYIGTSTPRNYSSDVQLVDETRNVDREIKIWMNNPLRFAGETFYQSGYFKNPSTGQESTTLAVVTNEGWMIPYVSCMIVATGLLAHFSIVLLRFLNRRTVAEAAGVGEGKPSRRSDGRETRPGRHGDGSPRWALVGFPVLIVLICAGYVAGKARPPRAADGALQIGEFGKIPLVYQGRVKPIDTLARNSLRIISGRQTFVDNDGNRQPAIRWLLDSIGKTEDAFRYKVFRIENLDLLDTLNLPRRRGFRYSFNEIGQKLDELTKQSRLAGEKDPGELSVYQKKVLELEKKIGILELLVRSFTPPRIRKDHAKEDLLEAIQQQRLLARRQPPLSIPPETDDGTWETYAVAWTKDLVQTTFADKEPNKAAESFTKILVAYGEDDADTFNNQVAEFRNELGESAANDVDATKTNFEAFFNHAEPFYYASVLYVAAFVLSALAWLGWRGPLNRAAFWLILFTFTLHTAALIARMYISGRPPVTNLYSSAVFIGWGGVVLGMILEMVYRMGIGNVIASVAGFVTLLIAHLLAGDGDTFVVLQAVLDTQFWLATHVTCITMGYATTYIAGMLGVLYILRGFLTPSLTPKIGRELSRMIYGTLCFAIFFSFVGTVLGGLWADDSWGRFWGWDPKENGALIIVLWNALVLHARWGGMVRERGLAVLAVAGNIATSWSWFGVNELGVGLHSYGFTEGVLLALGTFVLSQLAIIGVGCMPEQTWWSFQKHRPSA